MPPAMNELIDPQPARVKDIAIRQTAAAWRVIDIGGHVMLARGLRNGRIMSDFFGDKKITLKRHPTNSPYDCVDVYLTMIVSADIDI